MRRFGPLNITALTLGLAFLYLPIAILVINSFNGSRLVTTWGGWSLRWYRVLANDSAMLDAAYTKVLGEDFVKVLAWYDNEWGYSSRCVDLLRFMAGKGL